MKKQFEFAVMMLAIGLAGCGTIHVGNVPFSSREICSAEYSDFFRPNSSCLPTARAANIQSYYYEKKRLPISHQEALDIDNAALKQDTAHVLTPLMEATYTAANLRAMLKNFKDRLDELRNIDISKEASEVAAASTLSKLKEIAVNLNKQSGVQEAQTILNALNNVEDVPDSIMKQHDILLQERGSLSKSAYAAASQVAQLKILTASSEIGKLEEQISSSKLAVSADKTVNVIKLMNFEESFNFSAPSVASGVTFTSILADMHKNKDELENAAKQSSPEDAVKLEAARKLGHASALLQQMKYEGNGIVNKLEHSEMSKLSGIERQLDKSKAVLNSTGALLNNLAKSGVADADVMLNAAAGMLSGMLNTDSIAVQNGNLLPSLIGRVFTAKVMPSTPYPDGLFRVPGHEGNLELLPLVTGKGNLLNIPTEVLVNSDISGIVRKQMNVSASFDASQLMAKIQTPSVAKSQNLKAIMGAALASLDTGTGSYYYVSMTDEYLDSLTGKLHKINCMANTPPDRADTQLQDEPPYAPWAQKDIFLKDSSCNKMELRTLLKLDYGLNGEIINDDATFKVSDGLGIITGVAILRTRKGTSEVCSSIGAGIAPGKQAAVLSKPGADVCSELKNILQGHDVPPLEIAATLTSLNAAYRSESYKTLLIHDHASVLAIHWIPITLKKRNEKL